MTTAVTLYSLSYLENRSYNSHKKIEAAFAVKKPYCLGLLPSKGYSACQDTHTEGKKDINLPTSWGFVSINMHIRKHLYSCMTVAFVPSAL